MRVTIKECDLAAPVCSYLVAQGYTVRSEVKDCDLTAVKGDELIVVELKRGLTVDLLLQAVERQKVTDSVYVAIPGDGGRKERYTKRWKSIETLLKRLELGLIVVPFFKTGVAGKAEVVLHPIKESRPRTKPKQRKAVLREIAGRSDDYNVGGSVGTPLLTAYREQAIYIALCLAQCGQATPAALRKCGTSLKTQGILHRNVYGWFERLDRGVYALRPTVTEYLETTWPRLVTSQRERLQALNAERMPEP